MMMTTAMSGSFDPPSTAESSASLSGRGPWGPASCSAATFDVLRIQDALTETELSVVEAQAAMALSDIRLHLAEGDAARWLPVDLHNSPALQGIDDRH